MKMSDAFTLPVAKVESFDDFYVTKCEALILYDEHAKAAAHAINCHDGLVEALSKALSEIEAQTCYHEDTYRGGAIWTICRDCGAKWADDEGGFQKPMEPKRITMLRHVLAKAKGE